MAEPHATILFCSCHRVADRWEETVECRRLLTVSSGRARNMVFF